jgi:hypothetical protein
MYCYPFVIRKYTNINVRHVIPDKEKVQRTKDKGQSSKDKGQSSKEKVQK